MKNRMKITLLLSLALCVSFIAQAEFNESVELNMHYVDGRPFNDSFKVVSTDKDLQLMVFTLGGKEVPATIYKHHRGESVKYETGRELPKGLYLIQMHTEHESNYYKLIKM